MIPLGIYTIPEMASVGLDERQAVQRYGGAIVGRSRFDELARGQIAGITEGMLKMVADPQGHRLLGVQIIGGDATELIHVGQMGLLSHSEVDTFVDHIFNFPTFAEAYRVAALDIAKQRSVTLPQQSPSSAPSDSRDELFRYDASVSQSTNSASNATPSVGSPTS